MAIPLDPNSPATRALARKKELQDDVATRMKTIAEEEAAIKIEMQEIEQIEVFLRQYSRFSNGTNSSAPLQKVGPSGLARVAGKGKSQEVFEAWARSAMIELGRPMATPEVVEMLKRRGTSIGGSNEWKTASNRLWKAKDTGRFAHKVGVGYWPSDLPWPEKDTPEKGGAPSLKPKRGSIPARFHRGTGRPRGRGRGLNDEQVKVLYALIRAGKSAKEAGAELGGLSGSAIYNYVGRGKNAVAARRKMGIPDPPDDVNELLPRRGRKVREA
jgi:hypothetical protein